MVEGVDGSSTEVTGPGGASSRRPTLVQPNTRLLQSVSAGYSALPSSFVARLREKLLTFLRLRERFDESAIRQGVLLSVAYEGRDFARLEQYAFKVFSQWGEDGILQYLTREVAIANRTFIEFGVEDFSESNCRFLMMKDHWQGFVIDGSADNIRKIRGSYYFWRYELTAVEAFITRETINDLLARSGMDEDLGILSVDIDGNDYHVLNAIKGFRPRILVCEYNPTFGQERALTVPYRADFQRTKAHHSNLYWGASLPAFRQWAKCNGYSFVGTNDAGNNAFFVRDDLMTGTLSRLAADARPTRGHFRESRDCNGRMTYLPPAEARLAIAGLPVIDLDNGGTEAVL